MLLFLYCANIEVVHKYLSELHGTTDILFLLALAGRNLNNLNQESLFICLDSLDLSSVASRRVSSSAFPCPSVLSVGDIFPLIALIYTDIQRFCADPCHPWVVNLPHSAQGMFLSPYRSNDRLRVRLGRKLSILLLSNSLSEPLPIT